MSETRTRRKFLVGVFGTATAFALTACAGVDRTAESADRLENGAGGANADVDDYLPDAGLKQLRDASDLVVLGHVVNTASGIRISEDPNVEYTILTVSVDEVLKGNAGKTVDVALLTHIRRAAVGFDGRPTPKRGDRGVWLLTAIAPEFKREGYVLTNQNSQLLVKSDGAGLIGGASSSPVAREIRELGGLPGVLNRLREASK